MGSNEKKRRRNTRQAILVVLVIALLGFGVWKFQNSIAERGFVEIHIENPDGSTAGPFHVELATNDAERAKGLMGRKEMPRDEGMLFIYSRPANNAFWMKNTFLPLDMIFFDEEKTVVGILHNVPPFSEKRRRIDAISLYVLEVNAGVAKESGIVEGSKLKTAATLPRGV